MKNNNLNHTLRLVLLMGAMLLSLPSTKASIDHDGPRSEGREHEPLVETPSTASASLEVTGSIDSYNQILSNYLEKRLIQKPHVNIDLPTGSMRSGFSLSLPLGYTSLKSLDFVYDSSNFYNQGLGIGFSLNLPFISTFNDEIQLNSAKNGGILVPWKKDSDLGERRIRQLKKKINQDIKVEELYKNIKGEDLALYLKVSIDGESDFIRLGEDGESLIFNSLGQLERIIPLHGLGVLLSYDQDQNLNKIYDLDTAWELTISYLDAYKEHKKYVHQSFRKVPQGIKDIVLSQKSKKHHFNFYYDEEYLTKVEFVEAIKKVIFEGQYFFPKVKVRESKNSFTGSQSSQAIFEDNLDEPSWISQESNEDIVLRVDVNGDFFSDKIVIKAQKMIKAASDILKDIKYVQRGGQDGRAFRLDISREDLIARLEKIDVEIDVYINVQEAGHSVLKEDKSKALKISGKDLSLWKVNSNYVGSYPGWYTYTVSLNPNLLRVVDLDHNGLKDFIFCPNISSLDDKAQDLINSKGQKQNQLAHELNNWKETSKISDFFNHPGGKAKIFLQMQDLKKLRSLYDENRPLDRHVFNSTKWKELPQTNLHCHQHGLLLDYNHDGVLDMLTGRFVTTLAPTGESESFVLDDAELKKLFDFKKMQQSSQYKLAVVDRDGDGVFEVTQSLGDYVNPKDKTLVMAIPGENLSYERLPPVKLLSQLKTHWQGKSQIDYRYQEGTWVVNQVVYDAQNGKYSRYLKKIYYEGNKFHTELNTHLGFKKVIEKTTFLHNPSYGVISEKIFDGDAQSGPLLYYARALKNGRVLEEKKSQIGSEAADYWAKYEYTDKKIQDQEIDGFYLYTSSLKSKKTYTKGQGEKASVEVQNLSNYQDLIPLIKQVESNNEDKKILHESQYVLLRDLYLYRPSLIKKTDEFEKEIAPITHIQYDLDSGLVKDVFDDQTRQQYSYDSLARLLSIKSSNGKYQAWSYQGPSPKAASVFENGVLNHISYEEITSNIKSIKKEDSSTIFYDWSADGILLKIYKDSGPLLSINPSTEEGRSFDIHLLDQKKSITIDGFGRVIKAKHRQDNEWMTSWVKDYDFFDQVIFQQGPSRKSMLPQYTVKSAFDSLGRLHKKVYNSNLLTSLEFESHEFNESGFELIENLLGHTKKIKRDSKGSILETEMPGERAKFSNNLFGEVLKVKSGPLEASYFRDIKGNIIRSTSQGLYNWDQSKEIDYKNNRITYSDGGLEQYDPDNHLIYYTNSKAFDLKVSQKWQYKKGLLESNQIEFANQIIQTKINYDQDQKKRFESIGPLRKSYQYDAFDRLQEEKIEDGQNLYQLEYSYSEGLIKSLKPWIKNLHYDESGQVVQVNFSNGVIFNYDYGHNGRLKYQKISLNNKQVFISIFKYNKASKLIEIKGNLLKNEKFSYSNDGVLIHQDQALDQRSYKRDASGQLKSFNNFNFIWDQNHLVAITSPNKTKQRIYQGFNKNWFAICQEGEQKEECLTKLSEEEFINKENYQRLVQIGSMPIGIIWKNNFYPLILGHKFDVQGLVSSGGEKLEFVREFDRWGRKEGVRGNKQLEKEIPWSFGKLIQLNDGNGDVLISKSRSYIPALHAWAQVDELVQWNPDLLAKQMGNWDPIAYVNNDPVNFVDPSGTMAGDVWLYKSDRSMSSQAASMASFIADLNAGAYTHASIEINGNRQFTANTKYGANAIIKSFDIISNVNGNDKRIIDIYRHKSISQFDSTRATHYAEIMNKYGGKYFSEGWCSDRAVEGIRAGGLSIGDYGIFSTPNDFSRDRNFDHVGSYNTILQMSIGVH